MQKDVPELYELKNVFGNNNWHYETTFDHTVNVLKEFEKFFEEYKNFFDDKKKNLFKWVILLHDIAKKETLVVTDDGRTSFPNHWEMGARKADLILRKLKLSDENRIYIVSMIKNHHLPHDMFGDDGNYYDNFVKIKNNFPDIYKEILLMGFLDTKGSNLENNDKEKYDFRINVYKKLLEI